MKIIVIGCGSIGQRHIRNLKYLKVHDILVFDIDRERLRQIKKISSRIQASHKLNNLLNKKPEAAIIAVPTALHIGYATKAAKAGCHLFIEKPLSHNVTGLDKLIRIVKNKRLVTFIGYNFRFSRCLLRIKQLLDDNAIGKVIAGRTHFGSYLPERHPGEDYRRGYGAKKYLGGGVILDTLSHHIDYIGFLLGAPKEVFCHSAKNSGLDIDVEDTVELLIKFAKGEVISLHGDSIQRPYKHTLELIGEKGTIVCDFFKSLVAHYSVSKRRWTAYRVETDLNRMYIDQMRTFLDCVKRKSLAPLDIVDGKRQLKILMKIKESASKKRWIRI